MENKIPKISKFLNSLSGESQNVEWAYEEWSIFQILKIANIKTTKIKLFKVSG